jgi:hypothetical protein
MMRAAKWREDEGGKDEEESLEQVDERKLILVFFW